MASRMSLQLETTDIIKALNQQDSYRDVLVKALELHDQNNNPDWLGFLWYEVRGTPFTLNRWVAQGILDISFQSRKYTYYKLRDAEKTREALQLVGEIQKPELEPSELPDDLFDIIQGHTEIKHFFKLSLSAPRPVHILLVGPPATAKTLFLSELTKLPYHRYALGGTTSRAGIIDFLLREPCRYLIIDELDKADGRDLSALLSLMETGYITRLKKKMTELERVVTWVFAGANSVHKIPPELRSRFLVRELRPYTSQEFREIVVAVLTKRENIDAEMAHFIANKIEPKTKDVRDAVRVARLSKGNRQEIERLLRGLF